MLQELTGGLANRVYSISCASHPDDVIGMKVFSETQFSLMNYDEEYIVLKYLTHDL